MIAKKVFLPLLLIVALAATATDKPRVNRDTLKTVEKSLDTRLAGIWTDFSTVELGFTRGMYLQGYGAVFTAEISLIVAPVTMMHPTYTKQEVVMYRKKKMDKIPVLKDAMCKALAASAASLDPVPDNEQIVIGIFLPHYDWEDVTDLPSEITFTAQKKKLLDAQRTGGNLQAAVEIQEN